MQSRPVWFPAECVPSQLDRYISWPFVIKKGPHGKMKLSYRFIGSGRGCKGAIWFVYSHWGWLVTNTPPTPNNKEKIHSDFPQSAYTLISIQHENSCGEKNVTPHEFKTFFSNIFVIIFGSLGDVVLVRGKDIILQKVKNIHRIFINLINNQDLIIPIHIYMYLQCMCLYW